MSYEVKVFICFTSAAITENSHITLLLTFEGVPPSTLLHFTLLLLQPRITGPRVLVVIYKIGV